MTDQQECCMSIRVPERDTVDAGGMVHRAYARCPVPATVGTAIGSGYAYYCPQHSIVLPPASPAAEEPTP